MAPLSSGVLATCPTCHTLDTPLLSWNIWWRHWEEPLRPNSSFSLHVQRKKLRKLYFLVLCSLTLPLVLPWARMVFNCYVRFSFEQRTTRLLAKHIKHVWSINKRIICHFYVHLKHKSRILAKHYSGESIIQYART